MLKARLQNSGQIFFEFDLVYLEERHQDCGSQGPENESRDAKESQAAGQAEENQQHV
jgi:hypothetical protein